MRTTVKPIATNNMITATIVMVNITTTIVMFMTLMVSMNMTIIVTITMTDGNRLGSLSRPKTITVAMSADVVRVVVFNPLCFKRAQIVDDC